MSTRVSGLSAQDLDRIIDQSFVRRIEYHEQLPSTNDRALECAAERVFEGPLLVVAEQQTAGRGRGSNRWLAARGALTFSLAVDRQDLDLPREKLPQLSLATALAVGKALQRCEPRAEFRLKWPNDVYLHGRKVAGILLEAAAGGLERVVLGIGVNANNSFAMAPPELRTIATSMRDVSGTTFDLADVLIAILNEIFISYTMFRAGNLQLPEQWRPCCLLHGKRVQVAIGRQCVEGICCGIDRHGALLLRAESGLHRLVSGTVRCID